MDDDDAPGLTLEGRNACSHVSLFREFDEWDSNETNPPARIYVEVEASLAIGIDRDAYFQRARTSMHGCTSVTLSMTTVTTGQTARAARRAAL